MSRGRRAATLLSMWMLAHSAHADDKLQCMTAHERGQEARQANRWLEAQRLFLACAQGDCPPLIVKDCTAWQVELGPHIPSVVVSAKRPDGSDVGGVSLSIDGAPAGPLPAVPIPVDPGEHVLRFERVGEGAVEQRVTVRDGERDRRVVAQFDALSTPHPLVATPRTAGYVITTVGGVVGLGAAALLVVGKLSEQSLAGSACGQAGTCSDAQVAPIRAEYIAAGVAAGVAAIALGVGLWQLLAPRASPAAALATFGRITF